MAKFTETLREFLENNENSVLWLEVINKFNNFYACTIKTENEDVVLSMYDMFKEEYLDFEIGQEDEQKFFNEVKRQLNKSLIEFNPKIKAYIDKWDNLLSRKETLNHTEENDFEGSRNDIERDYINPINKYGEKISNKNEFDNKNSSKENKTKQYEMIYSLMGRSNVDMMKDLLDLRNIYLSCIESFRNLFMLVY